MPVNSSVEIVLRAIERLSIMAGAIACIIIGYRLFIAGVSGKASLVAEATKFKLRLVNASPGLASMALGVILLITLAVSPYTRKWMHLDVTDRELTQNGHQQSNELPSQNGQIDNSVSTRSSSTSSRPVSEKLTASYVSYFGPTVLEDSRRHTRLAEIRQVRAKSKVLRELTVDNAQLGSALKSLISDAVVPLASHDADRVAYSSLSQIPVSQRTTEQNEVFKMLDQLLKELRAFSEEWK